LSEHNSNERTWRQESPSSTIGGDGRGKHRLWILREKANDQYGAGLGVSGINRTARTGMRGQEGQNMSIDSIRDWTTVVGQL
jgi:hypothetical protein